MDGTDWPETLAFIRPPAVPDDLTEEDAGAAIDWATELLTTSAPERGLRGSMDDYFPIAVLHLAGELSFEFVTLPANLGRFRDIGGERATHQLGKALVAAWLTARGGSPIVEPPYAGGRLDVACETLHVAAEIGDVAPRRVTALLRDERYTEVVLLPISAPLRELAYENQTSEPIVALRLVIEEAGIKRLEELEQERLAKLKEAFRCLSI